MTLSLNRGTAVGYWRGPSAAPAVQLAAPHGSFPGIQDSIRPPWLVVEPKSAIKAATAEETDVTSLRERNYLSVYTTRKPLPHCKVRGVLPSAESVTFCWPCEIWACRKSRNTICRRLQTLEGDCRSTRRSLAA